MVSTLIQHVPLNNHSPAAGQRRPGRVLAVAQAAPEYAGGRPLLRRQLGANNFGGTGIGHAFAIVKLGSWGTAANNSEKTDSNYGSIIAGSSKISLCGPA